MSQDNGYITNSGSRVEAGYVANKTGAYLAGEVKEDSLVVQPAPLRRARTDGFLSLEIFGLTKDSSVHHHYAIEEDIYQALREADFFPGIKKVEFETVRPGASEGGEYYGISIPIRITFIHSPF